MDIETDNIVEYDKKPPVKVSPADSFISMIERVATNPDADIDKLERLYAMRKEEQDRIAAAEYNRAMSRVQKKVPAIKKVSYNEQTRSHYAKLEAIVNAIRQVYTQEGFSLSFSEGDCPVEGMVRVLLDVSHKGGDTRRFHYDNPIDNAGIQGKINKTPTHGKASAVSYAQRYLLNLVFLLDFSGQDDDGNAAGGQVVELVDDLQVQALEAKIADNGLDPEPIRKFLKLKGIDSYEEIPVDAYTAIMHKIQVTINAIKNDSEGGA